MLTQHILDSSFLVQIEILSFLSRPCKPYSEQEMTSEYSTTSARVFMVGLLLPRNIGLW